MREKLPQTLIYFTGMESHPFNCWHFPLSSFLGELIEPHSFNHLLVIGDSHVYFCNHDFFSHLHSHAQYLPGVSTWISHRHFKLNLSTTLISLKISFLLDSPCYLLVPSSTQSLHSDTWELFLNFPSLSFSI